MKTYPKIETLFTRDQKTFKVTGEIRLPEFENIKNWVVTEKIDGTNIRVLYSNLDGQEYNIEFRGRTDKADIPPFLLEELEKLFPHTRMIEVFKNFKNICLYGEGYGARIQKGGGNYREGVSFRLIDIWIDGWWLRWENVMEIADELQIKTVSTFSPHDLREAIHLIKPQEDGSGLKSIVAIEDKGNPETQSEGIVATAYPMVLFRNGNPVRWKLKKKDFPK